LSAGAALPVPVGFTAALATGLSASLPALTAVLLEAGLAPSGAAFIADLPGAGTLALPACVVADLPAPALDGSLRAEAEALAVAGRATRADWLDEEAEDLLAALA